MLGGGLIAYVPATAFKLLLIANTSLIIGILVGAIIGFLGLMLWFARSLRVVLGVMILLLSIASFFTSDFGGLLLGMIMGLVGGSLAIAWVPTKVTWRQRRRARKLAAAGQPAAEADDADVPESPTPEAAAVPPSDDEVAQRKPTPGPKPAAVPEAGEPRLADDLLGAGVAEATQPTTHRFGPFRMHRHHVSPRGDSRR